MVEGCRVDVEHADVGVSCIWMSGACDLGAVAHVRAALDDALSRRSSRVEVDLAGVTFIDAAGLHEIAWAAEHLGRAGGRVVVTSPSPVARRVLALAGLARLVGASTASCPRPAGRR